MDLIVSEQPSTEDRNVQLEPLVLEVGTVVNLLRGKVFPS
jgi:hypothetical protein